MRSSILPALLLVSVFSAAAGPSTGFDEVVTTTDSREYRGTATTTIRYYDFDAYRGRNVFVREQTYRYPVQVAIEPPLRIRGGSERNPFHLELSADRSTPSDEEGHLDLSSAAVFTVHSYNDLVLQYWTIEPREDNGFVGTLTDTHRNEAAAANLLWGLNDIAGLKMVTPFPIARNCTMRGRITDNDLEIRVQGESVDTYLEFESSISANRF